MNIYNDITKTVGNTPLVRLNKLSQGLGATVAVKLESMNPLWSVKDRIGVAMIDAAEKAGKLKPGAHIIEPTSGNTGIALAFVAAARGYTLTLTMPETMSIERRKLLAILGAEIVLTPGEKRHARRGDEGRRVAGENARRVHAAAVQESRESGGTPGHHGRGNMARHGRHRGHFCRRRRHRRDDHRRGRGDQGAQAGFKAIAVEPTDSPVLTSGKAAPHKIQGIGAGFVPDVLRRDLIDEIITVKHEDAGEIARRLARGGGNSRRYLFWRKRVGGARSCQAPGKQGQTDCHRGVRHG